MGTGNRSQAGVSTSSKFGNLEEDDDEETDDEETDDADREPREPSRWTPTGSRWT